MITSRPGRFAAICLLVPALLAVLAAAVLVAACGSSTSASSSASPAASGASGPITVTDDSGKAVTLKQPAQRIVSLAPADTEIAYAIGAGPKMVAGSSYDDYPAAAKALPKVGDFSNPSVEKIISFKPDLVLAAGGIQSGLRDKIEALGVPVYVVDPKTYDQAVADLQSLGKLAGTSAQAETVAQSMMKTKQAVQAKVGSLTKPTVFFEVYPKPLITAGSGTFINDMIALAGGSNIGAGAGSGYPNFSNEVLIKDNPDVFIAVKGTQMDPGQIAKQPGFSQLKSVKNGKVYIIEDNIVVRPGPRMAQGLEQLAKMIHPEAYTTP